MSDSIQSVVIVGGGTAGWITAGTIAAKLILNCELPIKLTLVESPNIPIIGVGEGTWPTMRNTLKKMGVRETDFIRECNVSFKQGARFSKWATGKSDDCYFHPLMLPQAFHNTNLAPHWLVGDKSKAFSKAVCVQDYLCELGLAPKDITTPEYVGIANYAYHLDAGKFSEFLKQHCISKLKVKHILDSVIHVNVTENGDIASVTTQKNGEISGDLFIDCTGFQSLLLGEHFGVPFKSCQDILFLDTALAVQVPYPDENFPIVSHTISTAQSAGWIWDIGLVNRRGVGYVYSSAHTDEDQAVQKLRDYISGCKHNKNEVEFRKIPIKSGYRTKFWEKNCVAVGLSAGFLEPLEASALVLIEMSATMIADQFPASRISMDVIAKRFNNTFQYRWERIIDFLKLHYVLSSRTDSEFWIDNRRPETIPESLRELLLLWKYQCPWHDDFDRAAEVFPAASYQYVLYGMGFDTKANYLSITKKSSRLAQEYFYSNEIQLNKLINVLPKNRELIEKIYKYGLQLV